MKVTVVTPRELGAGEVRRWSEIQRSDDVYASPCLSPYFTRAIAAKRDDIFVAVLEDGNRTVGFFPFQRNARGEANAGKQRMADYEAVVVDGDAEWTAVELLRGCGLAAWNYEAMIGGQRQFSAYHREVTRSAIVDLREGFEAYAKSVRRRGSRLWKRLNGQRKAMERQYGPMRYEHQATAPEGLAWLKEYKSAHYLRTGKPDHFQTPWVAAMVDQVYRTQEADFAGTLSLLYAGERIVAGHLGTRTRTVWHYWLPCYDRGMARYSPGSLLLMEMAKAAEGIRYLDLGGGSEEYKQRFCNGWIAMAAGSVVVGG